jgi:hypothetical protein
MEARFWPYQQNQIDWLSSNASVLSKFELKVLLRNFKEMDDDVEYEPCAEHGKFCEHLGMDFFGDLDIALLRLLLVWVTKSRRKHADPPNIIVPMPLYVLVDGKFVLLETSD